MTSYCEHAVLQAPYSQHSHHKSQTFVIQKGYALEQPPIPEESDAPPPPLAAPEQEDAEQQRQHGGHTQSSTPMTRKPKWIENDGKASAAVLLPTVVPQLMVTGLCCSVGLEHTCPAIAVCNCRFCAGTGTSRRQSQSPQERPTESEGWYSTTTLWMTQWM